MSTVEGRSFGPTPLSDRHVRNRETQDLAHRGTDLSCAVIMSSTVSDADVVQLDMVCVTTSNPSRNDNIGDHVGNDVHILQ